MNIDIDVQHTRPPLRAIQLKRELRLYARRRLVSVRLLRFSDGTRAKERGEDLESVAARLPDCDLVFWFHVFAHRGTCYHETRILAAELDRRRLSAHPEDLPGQRLLF